MIGKIKRLPLRAVWENEATDFSKWLCDNLDTLNELLDLHLESAEKEQSTGSFSVDLLADDGSGNKTVIENQLSKSNHDHLGKVLVYLTAFEASTAIWICSEPRAEHIGAIKWLNDSYSAKFYLVKLEAVQIGDSDPAPLMTLIVGPSESSKTVGKQKKEWAERHTKRLAFWKQLLKKAKTKTNLHANISPGVSGEVGTGAGKQGLGFNYAIRKDWAFVDLYIDRGKGSEEENKAIFDELESHRRAIEAAFGGKLEWQRLEGKRACRVLKSLDLGGYQDEEKWETIQDAMVKTMIPFVKALRPYIDRLKAGG
jgi:hypothetical protein